MKALQVSNALTAEQQGQVFGILSVGCDRETAANFVGCTLEDFGRAMRQDAAFALSVRRTEATVELAHMRTVHEAAKDPKNWRASVWWLECRSPERFASRGPGTVTTRNLRAFIQLLSDNLNNDIQSLEDRERVLNRLREMQHIAESLDDSLWIHPGEEGECLPEYAQTNETGERFGLHSTEK